MFGKKLRQKLWRFRRPETEEVKSLKAWLKKVNRRFTVNNSAVTSLETKINALDAEIKAIEKHGGVVQEELRNQFNQFRQEYETKVRFRDLDLEEMKRIEAKMEKAKDEASKK